MDDVRAVEPIGHRLDADVRVPGSKSFTNRALVCAALAPGRSQVRGALFADDTEAMLEALGALGVALEIDRPRRCVTVTGTGGAPPSGPVTLDVRMSGTTARFVAPLVALGWGPYRLTGHPAMLARPMGPVLDALRELGVEVAEEGEPGHLPAVLTAPGALEGGRIRLPGHLSSQFLSGLLLAAPCMRRGLVVELTTELVSKPYLDVTEATMRSFGVAVGHQDGGRTYVVAPHRYAATDYEVEPDASAASYFFAAAAVCGGRVRVEGLGRGTVQGDLRFVELLARMGADVEVGRGYTEVRGTGRLRGITADMADISDTAQTLAVVAGVASGPTRVTGIGFIRRKETDRIAAVVAELRRCGVDAEEEIDGFVVRPRGAPHGATVATYDDHRMAMSFAVLGLVVPGVAIADPGCVAKTFPEFFEVLDGLRASTLGYRRPAMPARVIAIDGPAGSGKSTVARAIAERLGLEYLDTGAMYRSVAFAALRAGVDPADAGAVAALAASTTIDVSRGVVTVDGVDASIEIRGPEVTRAVSIVAANAGVRAELVSRQREWAARRGGGVIEGRDIGSVVFPDAVLKVYLTASAEARASRRAKEVTDLDYETVAADIARRDALDQGRETSPLVEAADAVTIDTTDRTVDQIVDDVLSRLPDDG